MGDFREKTIQSGFPTHTIIKHSERGTNNLGFGSTSPNTDPYTYVPSQKTIPEPGLRENYIKYIITIEIKIDKCYLNNF